MSRKIKIKKDDSFMYYPTLEDENFYKNIYLKKEFHKNKIPKQTKRIEELCNPTEYTLSPQQNFLKNYISVETPYNGILVFWATGVGKCHAKDTPIIMSDGTIKMVQDIEIGDTLMGDDSNYRTVISLSRGEDEMYNIKQEIGDDYIVNSEHILCLKDENDKVVEISVKDYLKQDNLNLKGYKYGLDKTYNIEIEYHKIDNYYGFTLDGNHRYLLGDFTVTHNSCAAITIAEQFKEHIRKYNKKALIILKKSIQKGFIQQIHNVNIEKVRKDDVVQCTGDTYSLSEDDRHLTMDQKRKKIRSMIRQNYEFVGYEQFANDVKRKTKWDGNLNELTTEIKKKIERAYSNRVIIIDEVHHINVKTDSDVNIKKVPPILETIIRYSKNVRLVLMSATPMYDQPKEIIFLLNLLLLNDKRDTIKISDVFDSNGIIKSNGDKILTEASRGYVSYLRGENPITFPLRLYSPESVVPKMIKYDIRGKILKPDERIRYLRLVLCNMSEYQFKAYQEILKGTDTKNIDNVNNENDNNVSNNKRKGMSGLSNLIYVSNIIYPTKLGKFVFAKHGISSEDNGNGAFQKIIQVINKRKRVTYKYQSHTIFNKGTKEEKPFLSKDYLQKYSNKFYKALNNIIESKGIVFIYSRYIDAGVLPFALALEQNGITRYEDSGDKSLLDYRANSKGGGGKTNPICFHCGKFASDAIHKPTNPKYHKWYQTRYMLLTGNKELTKIDIGKAMNIINSEDNKYGENVKIIIGNEAVSEGIDFHRIRQVHILEPWYNISSLEQIIGRGIRNCSHKDLPEKDRNVEIFLYASTPSIKASLKDRETETIDERKYRISEMKDIKIKNVEHILKKSAVDCLLNKNGNIFSDNKELSIETSSGHKIKHSINDKPYNRACDYMADCNYKCNWESPKGKELKINEDTYNLIFAKGDIELAKRYIKMMYRKNIIYNLDTIVKNVRKDLPTIEDKYIYKALDEIIKNKDELVYDKFNREGYLIYRGKYYIYQPKEITDESIPLYYRKVPITSKTKDLQLLNYVKDISVNDEKNEDILKNISEKIKSYGKLLENTINVNNIKINDSFNAILGIVLDRLSENDIVNLLKNIIIEHNKKKLDKDLEKKILEYYVNNLFLEALITNKDKKLNSEILGFKFRNKYYCIKDNNWILCGDDIRKRIELLHKKILSRMEKKEYNILGLITYNKKNEVIFQIVDKNKYKESITLQEKKSKRTEITGRTCETYSLDMLYKLRNELNMKNFKDKGKKTFLCLEIEFFFRLKDNIDPNRKWLINNAKD